MYRLDDNPKPRFPENRPLQDETGFWIVAHLKSRREKAFALEMTHKGISYYLPLYVKRTRRKDNNKPRKSICPLFGGYVAVAPQPDQMERLLQSPNVAGTVKVVDQKRFTRELCHIETLLAQDLEFQLHPRLLSGTRVRVVAGMLKGLEGEVVRMEDKSRLQVSVDLFGQAVSVDINENDLIAAE
ncbi:MAG: hypothetical protein A2293_07780 [Elusimicrobia bacterium RIFOXYB2_FULL_49_7]|nr:MAG: hypothetical protein A2293_07780 [Elusimicrobia bacterium RIFOXYB2_FULL_49_7]